MKPELRPFWIGWGAAVALVAAATAGAGWVISESASWPLLPLAAARVGCLLAALLVFVAAFRLALLGTMSLKRVLATNLAIVIAAELEVLRRAADAQAQQLGGEPSEVPIAPLPIPRFFGERNEVRRLLGRASERSLEELLDSLRDYNAAVRQERPAWGTAGSAATPEPARQLRDHIRGVLDAGQRAVQAVAPFCRADV